jgi:RNA-binding protein
MASLTSTEKKKLKSAAHHLKPVVQIGKKGLTVSLITAVDNALESHELIKIKFLEYKDDKDKLSIQISDNTSSEIICIIGNIVILYREKKEKIDSGQ